MYINSLHIEKYKILEDLKMEFQIPTENQNIVNIIAGVNGSGKTTLLQYILEKFSAEGRLINGNIIRDDNIAINETNWIDSIHNYILKLTKNNQYINGVHTSPRVIYIPSNMTFNYQAKNMLDITYKFQNIID